MSLGDEVPGNPTQWISLSVGEPWALFDEAVAGLHDALIKEVHWSNSDYVRADRHLI